MAFDANCMGDLLVLPKDSFFRESAHEINVDEINRVILYCAIFAFLSCILLLQAGRKPKRIPLYL